MRRSLTFTPFDGLLLLMVLIWGANYSVVKSAIKEIPPQAFNVLRMGVASAVFAAAILARGLPRVARTDWARLVLLGTIGHFVYQVCFMAGLARTTASNSALIIGCSPVAVSIASALAGHERVLRAQWAGVLLSVLGVYLVVGTGARIGGSSLAGDLFTLGAVCCWAVYTVCSRPLLERHSPLVVTGYSMALGTAMFVPATIGAIVRAPWSALSPWAWAGIAASAVLALNLAYLIWYTAVQRLGNARTSMYSNMVPVTAMLMAWVGLGERIDATQIAGAAAILGGVLLTRWSKAGASRLRLEPPAEG